MAFNYERYWFNAEAGNWPDLREASAPRKSDKPTLTFSTFWCHGAPGIALSRIRAHQILADLAYKAEAMLALQTTRTMIEAALTTRSVNFSLCHGLAGNAEVLLLGSQALGADFSFGSEIAREVAEAGIRLYASPGHDWPCGSGSGSTPSLMLGLAGIGYFYLRLQHQALPSLLLLRNEEARDQRSGKRICVGGGKTCQV
jgi:lantibiotic modifying enzyme